MSKHPFTLPHPRWHMLCVLRLTLWPRFQLLTCHANGFLITRDVISRRRRLSAKTAFNASWRWFGCVTARLMSSKWFSLCSFLHYKLQKKMVNWKQSAYSCHSFDSLGMRIFATFSMETIQSSGNVSLAAKLQFWRAELGYGSGHLQFIIPGCGDLLYLGHCSAFQKEHFAELWVNFRFFLD